MKDDGWRITSNLKSWYLKIWNWKRTQIPIPLNIDNTEIEQVTDFN
jgi:hypothetical protein